MTPNKNMTAEERASKLAHILVDEDSLRLHTTLKEAAESISIAIKSAESAAREEGKLGCIAHAKESYCPSCEGDFNRGHRVGAESMRERAAKACDPGEDAEWGQRTFNLMKDLSSTIMTLPLSPSDAGKGD